MNLLDHPLVDKHFGCTYPCYHVSPASHREAKALRILQSMQEKISAGERYLMQDAQDQSWTIGCESRNFYDFHPFALRLPDRFQTKKEIEMSPMPCGCRWVQIEDCSVHGNKTKDEVEERIHRFMSRAYDSWAYDLKHGHLEKELRELVELARKK